MSQTKELNEMYDMKKDNNFNENEFTHCKKCNTFRWNIKDWMTHLVEYHPIPKIWMSDKVDINCTTPYTIVTESRKKRKRDSTPRPLNSFMIFSRHLRRVALMFFMDASNSEISKLLGKFWLTLPIDTKSLYDSEAKRLAILHSKEFPDYKYKPQKRKKNLSIHSSVFHDSFNLKEVQFPVTDKPDNNVGLCFKKEQMIENNQFSKVVPLSGSSYLLNCKNKKNRQISISNCPNDEFNDTESSASSLRLPSKTEIFQSISPMSDWSFESISERNLSPYAPTVDQYNVSGKGVSVFNNQRHFLSGNSFKSNLKLPESTLSFTQPLSIITENMNYQTVYISTKNRQNIVNERSRNEVNKKGVMPMNYQIMNKDSKELSASEAKERQSLVKRNIGSLVSNANLIPKKEPSNNCSEVFSKNLDPLITDDNFNKDPFVRDSFNVDRDSGNQSLSWQPWFVQSSPNFKLSTISSTSSTNNSANNCQEIYESPSPFLLSETDQPSQKLPAIGSWLRSNYSEYTI